MFKSKILLQESSITEAVEKQLQGAMQSSLTPLMGKKTQMSAHSHHETVTTPMSGMMITVNQLCTIL